MGYDEENYYVIKEIIADYVKAHPYLYDYIDEAKKLSSQILKQGCPAKFELIKIASECF